VKNTTKGNILKAVAIALDVCAPFVATLTQFPIWVNKSAEATFSGLFIIFAFLSCLPFIKYIKAYFRSPSVWVVWLVLFVSLFALRSIISEMLIVCFIGAISNCIGAVLYKIGKKISLQEKRDDS
jgi:hypothetical protein